MSTQSAPRYREFTLPEIQKAYPHRRIYDDGQHFVIKPLNAADGPIRFALPKVLPVDTLGRLIDPTVAMSDRGQLLTLEMRAICTERVYVHFGHSDRIPVKRSTKPPVYKMILDDYGTADTLRVEVHYPGVPAWGQHHTPLPRESFPGEVLVYDSQPLNGVHWIDFWLVKIADGHLQELREVYQNYQVQRFQMGCET